MVPTVNKIPVGQILKSHAFFYLKNLQVESNRAKFHTIWQIINMEYFTENTYFCYSDILGHKTVFPV